MQYLAVVETTKRGEPHLHIITRSGWISQKELSAFMKKHLGAPIVDVRLVKGKKDVASYVTKYISKRPIKLGKLKRYWRSTGYLDAEKRAAERLARKPDAVWIVDADPHTYRKMLGLYGIFTWEKHPDDCRWTMYEFEPRPPGPEHFSRRVR
jgi:hypothetical protein